MVKSQKGFTLIELLIVIGIIGILSVIAVPNFMRFQAKAKQTEAKVGLSGLYTAEKAFYSEYASYYDGLVTVGFQPEGASRYYYIGFNGGNCGTAGAQTIQAGPPQLPPPGSPPNTVVAAQATFYQGGAGAGANNGTVTLATMNQTVAGGAGLAMPAPLAAGTMALSGHTARGVTGAAPATVVPGQTFVAGACGVIKQSNAAIVQADLDIWHIDDLRNIENTQNGT